MSDVMRFVASVNSLSGKLLVAQTNPGEDANAVMICEDQSPQFVLASDYDKLEADHEAMTINAGRLLTEQDRRRWLISGASDYMRRAARYSRNKAKAEYAKLWVKRYEGTAE